MKVGCLHQSWGVCVCANSAYRAPSEGLSTRLGMMLHYMNIQNAYLKFYGNNKCLHFCKTIIADGYMILILIKVIVSK